MIDPGPISYEPIIITTITQYLGYNKAKFINKAWRKYSKEFTTDDDKVGLYLAHMIFRDKIPNNIDPSKFSVTAMATVYAYLMIYNKTVDYGMLYKVIIPNSSKFVAKFVKRYVCTKKNCIKVTREMDKLCIPGIFSVYQFIKSVASVDQNIAKKIVNHYFASNISIYIKYSLMLNADD